MVRSVEDQFYKWLDEIVISKRRSEVAKELGADIQTLEWAFAAGYAHGEHAAMMRREVKQHD
jgi:hypothetical protein